jgi:hypothetical protein
MSQVPSQVLQLLPDPFAKHVFAWSSLLDDSQKTSSGYLPVSPRFLWLMGMRVQVVNYFLGQFPGFI